MMVLCLIDKKCLKSVRDGTVLPQITTIIDYEADQTTTTTLINAVPKNL